jgi:hypothetical protein
VLHLVPADRTDNPNRVTLEPLTVEEKEQLVGGSGAGWREAISSSEDPFGGNTLLLKLGFSVWQFYVRVEAREEEIWVTVDRMVESLWRVIPRSGRAALRALSAIRPEHRTVFAKTELDALHAVGDESIVETLQRFGLADDLGDSVRVHPRVRTALIRAGLQVTEDVSEAEHESSESSSSKAPSPDSTLNGNPRDLRLRTDDYALVIGVTQYTGLGIELPAVKTAATAMVEWLSSPEGGDIPRENLTVLAQDGDSDDYPSQDRVERGLVLLAARAHKSNRSTPPRRLYFYFNGLVTPGTGGEVGIVLDDSTRARARAIALFPWVHYFVEELFEQVVIVVDGVSDSSPTTVSTQAAPPSSGGTREPASLFRVRNVKPLDGERTDVIGLTAALIDGLRGAAASSGGTITSGSLASYIGKRLRASSDIPPDIEIDGEIVFTNNPPPAAT